MFKWIARKILGSPQIIDEKAYAEIDKQKLALIIQRLKAAYDSRDDRKIFLLGIWLSNRGVKPPVSAIACDDFLRTM